MRAFPTGTVTFLFTDMEGSTRLVQRLGDGHRAVFEAHSRLLREAVARCDGLEVAERGDGFFFVFAGAGKAAVTAVAAQRSIAEHPWPPEAEVRVRIGLHSGEGKLGSEGYTGLEVHRAARIADAGHGGQVLLSGTTAALIKDGLPAGLSLRALGRHSLKDLPQPEEIFQLVIEGLQEEFPPLRTVRPASVRLPSPLTSFVGRERELREVQQRLQQTRLLTLTGPGGIGKTRLSLQVAAEAAPGFRDGVIFVALAQIRDPELLVPTIITALALPERATELVATLRQYLSSRQLLLILDNFEQLLSAGPLVTGLLQEAPELKLLVTSRAALHVYGEQEYPVPSLGLPVVRSIHPAALTPAGTEQAAAAPVSVTQIAASEAVALFVARGAAARPDFALTHHNAAAVAEIATRLDGLPLAIELAAARLKIMTPEAMVARLSSRLTLLTGGARDLPDRMKTLRGAISWSYELLEPRVQRLFARLAVFHGGACLTELESVCRLKKELGLDTLEGLTALVDHSLLKQAQAAEEPRFTMLETIREFAYAVLEQSGEIGLLLERHSQAFLALAQTAQPQLTKTRRLFWVGRLETDLENLRAALAGLLDSGQAGPALRMVAALWRFWLMRAHVEEGRQRAAQALQLPGGQVSERIAALSAAGSLAYWQMDSQAADRAFREAVELARQLGDGKTTALTLYDSGFAALIGGKKDQALALVTEGLALAREVGDPIVLAELLCALGTLYWRLGNLEAAAPPLEEAVQLLAGSEEARLLGWAHGIRGQVRLSRGDVPGAREDFRAVEPYADKEDLGQLMLLLFSFARIALTEADLERALRLAGAAMANQERSQLLVAAEQNLAAVFEPAAARIGKQRAEELMAEGRLMSTKEALDYAMQTLTTDERPGSRAD